jgi:hypothetical protein
MSSMTLRKARVQKSPKGLDHNIILAGLLSTQHRSEFGLPGVEGPSIFRFTALRARIAYRPTENFVIRTATLGSAGKSR